MPIDCAFNGCDKLIETVNGVGYVDKWVVSCDKSVTKVELKADTVGIAGWAFETCSSLTEVTISQSVKSICDSAFRYCSSLMKITIPDSVTSVGEEAFYYCFKLTDINYNGSMEEWKNMEDGKNLRYQTGNYVVHCTDGDIKKS